MKLKSVVIIFILMLSVSVLAACGTAPEEVVAPTEEVVPTKSERLKELEAMEPTFEVYFDGKNCRVEGPSEIKTGEHLFVLHNQHELLGYVGLSSYFEEASYEKHFQWREENCAGPEYDHFECEENCGGQGTYCTDGEKYQSYTLITHHFPLKEVAEESETDYFLYEITFEREYVIKFELGNNWIWLCDSFQVTK